jgi:hypothetical protein
MRIIQLSTAHAQVISQKAKGLRPRVNRWTSAQADTTSETVSVKELNLGKYSSKCRFVKIDYSPRIKSCGYLEDGCLVYWFGKIQSRMYAPMGWIFGEDKNGLFLERVKNKRVEYRYHFTSGDLSNKTSLRSAAISHEKKQREVKKNTISAATIKKYERIAKKVGIMVTFRDSLNSGNCPAGTKSWIDNKGLSAKMAYPLEVVKRIGNGDKLVERACEQALKRSIEDIRRGYCVIR